MKKLIISIMAVMLFLTGAIVKQEKATLEKDMDDLQKEIKIKRQKRKASTRKRKISR